MDSTGDLLTLVPLHDSAYTSAVPLAPASPTPSSTSTVARSVISVTTTDTAATSTTSVAVQSPAKRLRLDSFFNTRRGYHVPLVSLVERKDNTERTTPPAPAPVSLGPADWRTWLGGLVGSGNVTGDQIDALCMYFTCITLAKRLTAVGWGADVVVVAGPDRPVPEKPERRPESAGYTGSEAGSSKAGTTAASAERSTSGLYDRLHAAVSERG
jgi:hypothetical protein